ncbi:MAG: AAA family ATPase [Magnetococcales bacterium]|nr:AAA family ATPase [Magnetococcales bacterium]
MEAVRPATPAPSRSADQRQSGRRPQFFSAKSHAAIWRVLRAALLRAEGVILLTGVEGSGKSSLLKRLPGMIPDNRDLAMVQSADLPDSEFLQQLIAATTLVKGESGSLSPVDPHAPDVPTLADFQEDHPSLTLQDLVDAMEERVAMGRKLVLVVDQAHLLNPETLAWLDMMARFVSEGIKPVQLLLSGQPELRSLLESETGRNLADKIVGSCEVTPLTRGEVWDYLAFQLDKSMGWPVRVSWFGWMEIYAYSLGIPLKIDLLLRRVLPLVRQRNAKVVTRSMVRLAMTMGKPMERGSFLATLPVKTRVALLAGSVVFVSGTGYLAGLFDSPSQPSEKPVAKKGDSGEGSAYIRIVQPETPGSGTKPDKTEKTDKPTPPKDAKSPEEKTDDRSPAPKKRYWEPSLPNRASDTPLPQPIPERAEPGLAALAKPSPEAPLPGNRSPVTDPEAFRKRYQTAKTASANAPAPAPETQPVDMPSEPAAGTEAKKATPPATPLPLAANKTSRPTSGPDGAGDAEESAKPRDPPRLPPPPPPPPPLPSAARHTAAIIPPGDGGEKEELSSKPANLPAKPVPSGLRPPAERKGETEEKPTKPAPKTAAKENAPLPHITGVATEKSFRAVGKLYVVQIGSFTTQEGADSLKQTLSGNGRDPYVHLSQKKNRRFYSVRMNYRARDAAERMAHTIQQQEGLSGKVLELNYD